MNRSGFSGQVFCVRRGHGGRVGFGEVACLSLGWRDIPDRFEVQAKGNLFARGRLRRAARTRSSSQVTLPILPSVQDTHDQDSTLVLDVSDHVGLIGMKPDRWVVFGPFARKAGIPG